jgi:hypothetical protein
MKLSIKLECIFIDKLRKFCELAVMELCFTFYIVPLQSRDFES